MKKASKVVVNQEASTNKEEVMEKDWATDNSADDDEGDEAEDGEEEEEEEEDNEEEQEEENEEEEEDDDDNEEENDEEQEEGEDEDEEDEKVAQDEKKMAQSETVQKNQEVAEPAQSTDGTRKPPTKSKISVKRPPTGVLVNAAIKQLSERNGSSLQAIIKYIMINYPGLTAKQLRLGIKKYLKKAVTEGELVQTTGTGATGSFKISPMAAKNLLLAEKVKAKREKDKQRENEKAKLKKAKEEMKKEKKKLVKQATSKSESKKKQTKNKAEMQSTSEIEISSKSNAPKVIKKSKTPKSKEFTADEAEKPPVVEKPQSKTRGPAKKAQKPIDTLATKAVPKKTMRKTTATESAVEKSKVGVSAVQKLKGDKAVEAIQATKTTTNKKKK